ncbi:hypothetical protein ES702_02976 [subsurface metagenome]
MVKIELGNEISDDEMDKRIEKSDIISVFNIVENSNSLIKEIIKTLEKDYSIVYVHHYPKELKVHIGLKEVKKENSLKIICPNCKSEKVIRKLTSVDKSTAQYECKDCECNFIDIFIEV